MTTRDECPRCTRTLCELPHTCDRGNTFIGALDNPEGRALIDAIEDMLSSYDGENRYATEIASAIAELQTLTGYAYTLTTPRQETP